MPRILLAFWIAAVVAATAADNVSTPSGAGRGRLVVTSKAFTATGTAGNPAVVNLRLAEGHHRVADVVVSCFSQLAMGLPSGEGATTTLHEAGAEACAGAEVFLRISPGMEPHVALTIINDEGPVSSAPSRDGWSGATSHGVSKRCTRFSFDECSVNRDFTYTTSYKDVTPPAAGGTVFAAPPSDPRAPNNRNGTATNVSVTDGNAERLPPKDGYEVVDTLPVGLAFDSRMAGSVYRLNTAARHLLIEFKVPPELRDDAYLQLEVRLTGHSSGHTMLIGLIASIFFLTLLGNGLLNVRKYALRRAPLQPHLSPREVWALRARPGAPGGLPAAIVPDITLPEIVGKPVTPSRLDPEARRAAKRKEREQQQQEQKGAQSEPTPAPDSSEAPLSSAPTAADPAAASPASPSPRVDNPTDERDGAAVPSAATQEEDQELEEVTSTAASNGVGDPTPLAAAPPRADWAGLAARLRAAVATGPRPHRLPTEEEPDVTQQAPNASEAGSAAPLEGDEGEDVEPEAAERQALRPQPDATAPPAPAAAERAAGPSPTPPKLRAPLPPGTVSIKIPDSSSASDSDELLCRICQDASPRNELFAPCACAGSSKYVHRTCLEQWRYSTTNAQHRAACAECKTRYVTKAEQEEREQQQQQAQAEQQQQRGSALRNSPRARCCFRVLAVVGPPLYTAFFIALLGGYAVKIGAFVITGFDSGLHWAPGVYHFLLGGALAVSELMVVAQLSTYFTGYSLRTARVCLLTLGYLLPFAFGYLAMFFIWMVEVTLLRREAAFISGVTCQFVCSQYFLPTLNEYAARAEMDVWFNRDQDTEREEQAVRDALAQAVREAHRAAAAQQHLEQHDGEEHPPPQRARPETTTAEAEAPQPEAAPQPEPAAQDPSPAESAMDGTQEEGTPQPSSGGSSANQ